MDKCECSERKNDEYPSSTKYSYRKKRRRYNNVIDPIRDNLIDPVHEYNKRPSCDDKIDPSREYNKCSPCDDKIDPIYGDRNYRKQDNYIDNGLRDVNFQQSLKYHIGQTVTIFTTSGGQSGSGFTGVLMSVECNFVRLLTEIGPAPGCALGNACEEPELDIRPNLQANLNSNVLLTHAAEDNESRYNKFSLGSVVVIPLPTIAAFVHNAIGSSL